MDIRYMNMQLEKQSAKIGLWFEHLHHCNKPHYHHPYHNHQPQHHPPHHQRHHPSPHHRRLWKVWSVGASRGGDKLATWTTIFKVCSFAPRLLPTTCLGIIFIILIIILIIVISNSNLLLTSCLGIIIIIISIRAWLAGLLSFWIFSKYTAPFPWKGLSAKQICPSSLFDKIQGRKNKCPLILKRNTSQSVSAFIFPCFCSL